MTPNLFRQQWTSDGDTLVTFQAEAVHSTDLPEPTKRFLVEVGLPSEAAPFLSFGSARDMSLPTVAEAWGVKSPRLRIIGSNGFGDPICIDQDGGGRVVYLVHDDNMRVEPINSSVLQLAYSLLAFRSAVRATIVEGGKDAFLENRIPNAVADQFVRSMESIDFDAIKAGSFWLKSICGEGT